MAIAPAELYPPRSVFEFSVNQSCGKARAGVIRTAHGEAATPVFLPCGTCGAVRGATPDQLRAAGVQVLLANTYHLMLRPGADVVAEVGGLHKFMAWDEPLLTDSGGYQVFSLAALRKVTDEGIVFQSHVDGDTVELTPEGCMDIQAKLGADIIMQLDECPPAGAARSELSAAVARSAAWAARCRQRWQAAGRTDHQALFGIQQGGTDSDLRRQSAAAIVELDLPGYAVGGLSVGEGHDAMLSVLDDIDARLPREKPRYLMGVGEPRDILAAVRRGVDMFDCVLPTRNARSGQAFTRAGRLRLRNAAFTRDARPIEPDCPCYTCGNFSRAALRHYFLSEEMLGPTLVTIHNLAFFTRFMAAIRRAIAGGDLDRRAAGWLERMHPDAPAGSA